MPMADGLRIEAEAQSVCLPSNDMKEAITAFQSALNTLETIMFLNATVVYGSGWVRWFGASAAAALFLFHARSRVR